VTNCPDDIKTLLSKLVDGEITPDERATAEAHVADCAPCRELLDLFRKNETLLSNALESEAFGNAVIGSVVRKIRHEGPPEADPVDEGPAEWLRARPWLPLSAAAVLFVGLVILLVKHSSDVGALSKEVKDARVAYNEHLRASVENERKHLAMLRELRLANAAAGARGGTLGNFSDEGIVVKGGLDPRDFEYFEVLRRADAEAEFRKINTAKGEERLRQPEYLDRSARPGQPYWYKVRGVKAGGEAVESAPIRLEARPAGEFSPETSVKLHCFELAVTGDVGIFLLERRVDGRPILEKFVVRPGEPIGGPVDVPGVGRVNFTTGLTLTRIEDAHESIPVVYAEPVLDAQGRPVLETLKNGVAVPLTRQHDVALSIRPTLRAALRTDNGGTAEIFKGRWLTVRAK
jgi:hypothetical protein